VLKNKLGIILKDFENGYEEEEQKIENGLMLLCFLIFAFIGYLFSQYLHF